jgi:hypothetical protein
MSKKKNVQNNLEVQSQLLDQLYKQNLGKNMALPIQLDQQGQ